MCDLIQFPKTFFAYKLTPTEDSLDVTVWTLEDFFCSSLHFQGPPKLEESGASELKNSEIDVGCTYSPNKHRRRLFFIYLTLLCQRQNGTH